MYRVDLSGDRSWLDRARSWLRRAKWLIFTDPRRKEPTELSRGLCTIAHELNQEVLSRDSVVFQEWAAVYFKNELGRLMHEYRDEWRSSR